MSMFPTGYNPRDPMGSLSRTATTPTMAKPLIQAQPSPTMYPAKPIQTTAPASTYAYTAPNIQNIPQFSDITAWLDNYLQARKGSLAPIQDTAQNSNVSAYRGTNYLPVTQYGSPFISGSMRENPLAMAIARLGGY